MKAHSTFLLFIMLFFLSYQGYSQNINTRLHTMSPQPPKVGERITAIYEFYISQASILDKSNYRFTSSDDVLIENVEIKFPYQAADTNDEFVQTQLIVTMYIKSPGIHYIPHIQFNNAILRLPHINVISILDKNVLSPKDIQSYIPYSEIRDIGIFLLLIIIVGYLLLRILLLVFQQSNVLILHIKNLANIFHCLHKTDKIITQLKRLGDNRSSKIVITVDCYTQLLEIIQLRMSFYHSMNNLLSLTNYELKQLLITHIDIAKFNIDEVNEFFTTFDQVFYAHKKYSVKERIAHCMLVRKIIIHSFDNNSSNNLSLPSFITTKKKNLTPVQSGEFDVFR